MALNYHALGRTTGGRSGRVFLLLLGLMSGYGLSLLVLGMLDKDSTDSSDNHGNSPSASAATTAKKALRINTSPAWGGGNPSVRALSLRPPGKLNARLDSALAHLLTAETLPSTPDAWKQELAKLIELAETDKDKKRILSVLFSLWAGTDFESAFESACKLGLFARQVKEELLVQLANSNLEKALDFWKNNSENPFFSTLNSDFMSQLAENFARKSPDEALDWYFSVRATSFSATGAPFYGPLPGLLKGLPQDNPEQMLSYIEKFRTATGDVPRELVEVWASRYPEEALNWAQTQAEGTNRDSYVNSALYGLASYDPSLAETKAKEWISKLPQDKRDIFIESLDNALIASQSPEYVAKLSYELSQLSGMSQTSTPALESWIRQSPREAGQWIESLPSSSLSAEVFTSYASIVPSTDLYKDVLTLVNNKVDNPDKRDSILKSIVQEWREFNTKGFTSWLNSPEAAEHKQWIERIGNDDDE